jgi:hypothetical protein
LIRAQEETIEVNSQKIARVGTNPGHILAPVSYQRQTKKENGWMDRRRLRTIRVALVILTGAAGPDSL